MKALLYIMGALVFLAPHLSFSQNAPLTSVPDTFACTGTTITIPVNVTGFKNIGVLSLRLQFDASVLNLQSWNNSSGFPGLYVNSSISGRVSISGFTNAPGGFTIPNQANLIELTFSYAGGSTGLTWLDNGASCEYGGPDPTYTPLNDIPYEDYYFNGTVNPALVADFTSPNLLPALNEVVQLTDISSGNPTGWAWTFTPNTVAFVNGTSSSSQNPQVVFTGNGAYAATMTVTDGSCIQASTKNDYFHVGTAGLWTGQTSSDWNVASNWNNWLIPVDTTDVVIPPEAVNWPEFNGDLILGVHCKNLTLSGTTSQMTVTGDIIVH